MKKNKTIKYRVLIEIFKIWDYEENGLEKARDELKKLYLKEYYKLHDIEDKRLILYNLAVAEKDLKNFESVKLYSKILKDEMDKVPNYKTGDTGCLYARMLMNYTESHKSELSKEELKGYYEFCYKVNEKYNDVKENGYLAKLIAKFNLSLLNENFNTVLEVVKDVIHNNINKQYAEALIGFKNDLKNVDEAFYEQVLLLEKEESVLIKQA